ncbi:hypothetical protein D3C71_1546010 [compost metagenome]
MCGLAFNGRHAILVKGGIGNLARHIGIYGSIVALHKQLTWKTPQLNQPVIKRAHAAIKATDEHAVSRGVERCTQLGQQLLQLALGRFVRAPVQHGQHKNSAWLRAPCYARNAPVHRQQGAVSTQQTRMRVDTRRNHISRLGPESNILRCCDQLEDGHTNYCSSGHATEMLCRRIGMHNNLACFIHKPYGLLEPIQPGASFPLDHRLPT